MCRNEKKRIKLVFYSPSLLLLSHFLARTSSFPPRAACFVKPRGVRVTESEEVLDVPPCAVEWGARRDVKKQIWFLAIK